MSLVRAISGLSAALCVTVLASCSFLSDLSGAGDTAKAKANSALGLDQPSTCCVNQQFFECPDAAAGMQCLGEPLDLNNCLSACPAGDGDCSARCVGKHGPDTSGCKRAEARDGECKK